MYTGGEYCPFSHSLCLSLIFTSQDEKLLVGFLRSTLVDIALYFGPLDSLKATFSELKRERRLHGLLLNILHDLITHTSFQVRRYVGILLGVSVSVIEIEYVCVNYVYYFVYTCILILMEW